jgi:hypothetical protein
MIYESNTCPVCDLISDHEEEISDKDAIIASKDDAIDDLSHVCEGE